MPKPNQWKKCLVSNCNVNSKTDPNKTFYRMPTKYRQMVVKWLKAINRPDLVNLPDCQLRNKYICEKHFSPYGYIPSLCDIFPDGYPMLHVHGKENTQHKKQKRTINKDMKVCEYLHEYFTCVKTDNTQVDSQENIKENNTFISEVKMESIDKEQEEANSEHLKKYLYTCRQLSGNDVNPTLYMPGKKNAQDVSSFSDVAVNSIDYVLYKDNLDSHNAFITEVKVESIDEETENTQVDSEENNTFISKVKVEPQDVSSFSDVAVNSMAYLHFEKNKYSPDKNPFTNQLLLPVINETIVKEEHAYACKSKQTKKECSKPARFDVMDYFTSDHFKPKVHKNIKTDKLIFEKLETNSTSCRFKINKEKDIAVNIGLTHTLKDVLGKSLPTDKSLKSQHTLSRFHINSENLSENVVNDIVVNPGVLRIVSKEFNEQATEFQKSRANSIATRNVVTNTVRVNRNKNNIEALSTDESFKSRHTLSRFGIDSDDSSGNVVNDIVVNPGLRIVSKELNEQAAEFHKSRTKSLRKIRKNATRDVGTNTVKVNNNNIEETVRNVVKPEHELRNFFTLCDQFLEPSFAKEVKIKALMGKPGSGSNVKYL